MNHLTAKHAHYEDKRKETFADAVSGRLYGKSLEGFFTQEKTDDLTPEAYTQSVIARIADYDTMNKEQQVQAKKAIYKKDIEEVLTSYFDDSHANETLRVEAIENAARQCKPLPLIETAQNQPLPKSTKLQSSRGL